jgi:diguanylate cyclase (GGDEF)-like protein/PAS domain S-box-containing protein
MPALPPSGSLPASISGVAPRVLVVEDEAVVALDIQSQLQDLGFQVCGSVDTGAAAISAAHDLRPDIILMDLVLKGGMDGIEAAAQITRALHIPVIYLTAYSDMPTVERAAHSEAYGYLTKPFQVRELAATIQLALYKASLERRVRDSESRFAATLRSVAEALVSTDPGGHVSFMNAAACAMLGWKEDEALGLPVELAVPLFTSEGAPWSPLRQVLNDNRAGAAGMGSTVLTRSGAKLAVEESAAPIRAPDGSLLGAVLVLHDIGERAAAAERLRQSEQQFRDTFDKAPAGMALLGLDNRFLRVNAALCSLLEASDAELVGNSQRSFTVAPDRSGEEEAMRKVLSGEAESAQYEARFRSHGGKLLWGLVHLSLMHKRDDNTLCYLMQVHDLTERKEAEYQLERLAHFDPLTGLANRAWLTDELDRQIILARRHRDRLALVYLDLDHFKEINDTFGHEGGDEVLKALATRLRNSVRGSDAVARLGGDEFVILLPEIHSPHEVVRVTEKILRASSEPLELAGRQVGMSLSMGVSLYPDDAKDGRTLLRYADNALYHAKAEGRQAVRFYRPELSERAEQAQRMNSALRRAIDNHEFTLDFQPIVALADGAPRGAEALIRWNHPERGRLLPAAFMPQAEETGLSVPIGEWVIDEACRQAASWPMPDGSPLAVTVNLTARQFKSAELTAVITRALHAHGLEAGRLHLELSEALLLGPSSRGDGTLAGLKGVGVRLAVDNFGTGPGSLSNLGRLKPDELKIDGSLLKEDGDGTRRAELVRAAIAMAHSLNIPVVMAGMETGAA